MKKLTLYILAALLSLSATAQQEGLHTQFMFNKLAYNPAFAGRYDHSQLTGIYRAQWLGLEGAPESQFASLNQPFSNRSGLGISLARQAETIYQRIRIEGMYAYGFPLGPGKLRIGLSVSYRYLEQDFTDPRLTGNQPIDGDPAIQREVFRRSYGNTGLGVYYHTDRFFAGISVPRLLETDIDVSDNEGEVSRERRHFYLMGGVALDLNNKWTFIPQSLIKWTGGAPLNIDINTSFRYDEIITLGLTYRTGQYFDDISHGLSALAGWHLGKKWMIGMAYDLTLNELRTHQNGSLEFMLQWNFGTLDQARVINQRFF